MDKAMGYIGLARRSGNIELGEQRAKALVKSGRARLLIVASDTSPGAKRRAEGYVYGYQTPLINVPYTKEAISQAVGVPGCSMAAFADAGLALGFVRALDTQDETCAAAAAALEQRLERAGSAGRNSGNRRKRI